MRAHAAGQWLIVTDGVGRTEQEDGPVLAVLGSDAVQWPTWGQVLIPQPRTGAGLNCVGIFRAAGACVLVSQPRTVVDGRRLAR